VAQTGRLSPIVEDVSQMCFAPYARDLSAFDSQRIIRHLGNVSFASGAQKLANPSQNQISPANRTMPYRSRYSEKYRGYARSN
jgi:hypothetical protein